MIGVDIAKIERFVPLVKDADRFLSPQELDEMKTRADIVKPTYLAGRWAGKEAFVKATGLKSTDFRFISIIDDSQGKPHIYYMGAEVGEISISHDDYAVAFVSVNIPAKAD
jgi:holo-[acyl-carrier protein] synthase